MYEDFFEICLDSLMHRQFDKFSEEVLEQFCNIISIYIAYDIPYPRSYLNLRHWLYERLRTDFYFQSTGYLNEHAIIGIMWSAMLVCDKYRVDGAWNDRDCQ